MKRGNSYSEDQTMRGEESFHTENTEISDFGEKMQMILYINTHICKHKHNFILKK